MRLLCLQRTQNQLLSILNLTISAPSDLYAKIKGKLVHGNSQVLGSISLFWGILKSKVMCRFLYLIDKLLLLYANVLFVEMTIMFSLICFQCILLYIMAKFILTSNQNFQFSCVSLPVNLHMYDGGPPFTVSGAAWCTIVSYKITLEFIKAVVSLVITFCGFTSHIDVSHQ